MDGRRTALVLLAHPDDESLGCGGTIAKLVKLDWDVHLVIVSDGVVTVRSGGQQDNRDDCARACKTLGLAPPTLLGFADQMLDRVPMAQLSNAVYDVGLRPDLIITHSADDLNADHRVTAEAARIVGRPADRPISLLACEIPADGFWNGHAFPANFFVDITDTLDQKLEALACYEQELPRGPDIRSLEAVERLARLHGMQVGVPAAEAFHLLRGVPGTLP